MVIHGETLDHMLFTNGTGVITPGNLPVTSGKSIPVRPSTTTEYANAAVNITGLSTLYVYVGGKPASGGPGWNGGGSSGVPYWGGGGGGTDVRTAATSDYSARLLSAGGGSSWYDTTAVPADGTRPRVSSFTQDHGTRTGHGKVVITW